ncbi:hypothetical protein [Rosenbergiella nectarea]|uniref:hypothetical protein n=1 Tax=Rosenbergiella nectarea TaxID=988801 RepID=UPI001F4EB377|nr:hypothetical protein [Rosenbergiella nectarea]
MMNKLSIIVLKEILDNESQLISLSIKIDNISYSLYIGELKLSELIDWLVENEGIIRNEKFPVSEGNQESLAKKVQHFYESLDISKDYLVDKMFDYRASHCLRFACRGTDISEIYIGKSDNGYEISKCTKYEHWQYFFDIDDFFHTLKRLER